MEIEQDYHMEPAILIGTLRSLDVKRKTKTIPLNHPNVEGTIMQRWGRVTKSEQDTRIWEHIHNDAVNTDARSEVILKVLTRADQTFRLKRKGSG